MNPGFAGISDAEAIDGFMAVFADVAYEYHAGFSTIGGKVPSGERETHGARFPHLGQ